MPDDLRLNRDVQRGHSLVRDDQRRIERECAGDPDALALTAAEFMRVPRQMVRVETDQVEQVGDAPPSFGPRPELVNDERLFDDISRPHPRVQRRIGILKHNLHIAPRPAHARLGKLQDIFTAEKHLAGRGFDQSQDAPSGCALPAARLTDKAEHLAFVDRKAHVVHRLDDGRRAPEPAPADEVLDEVTHFEQRRGRTLCRG